MTISTSFTKKDRFPPFEETLFDLKDDGELSQNSQKVFKLNKKQTKMEKNSTLFFLLMFLKVLEIMRLLFRVYQHRVFNLFQHRVNINDVVTC